MNMLCKLPIARQAEEQGLSTRVREAIVPGITVGCMVVPQGIAYSILAGLPPAVGLYSATVGILVYALFGGSPELAVGPSAMVALLVKAAIDAELGDDSTEKQAISVAITLSLLVGVFQFAFGLLRLGCITNFIAHDVLVGFTSGAGIIIGFSQLKYLIGIQVGRHHEPFMMIWDTLSHLHETKIAELIVSLACLTLLLLMKAWRKRNPAPKPDAARRPTWWHIAQLVTSMSALTTVIIFTPLA